MIGVIYKYTSPSGKSYVGQTVQEKIRKNRHMKSVNTKSLTLFTKALRKYGFENFSYERLFIIHSDDKQRIKLKLDFMERYYIRKYDTYNNGYNMTLGGDGGSGTKHTEEFKQRQSERMKITNPAFKMSNEWKANISKGTKGILKSESMKLKASLRMKENNPMKNLEISKKSIETRIKLHPHLSEEHKSAISNGNKGQKRTEEQRQHYKDASKKRLRDSKGHFIKNNS